MQLISYLSKTNDVQTWATAISVIGGSKSVLGLLAPSTHMIFAGRKEFDELMKSKVASEIAEMYLEQMIYRYAQMLQKWGEGLKAAEVSLHSFYFLNELPNLLLIYDQYRC